MSVMLTLLHISGRLALPLPSHLLSLSLSVHFFNAMFILSFEAQRRSYNIIVQ